MSKKLIQNLPSNLFRLRSAILVFLLLAGYGVFAQPCTSGGISCTNDYIDNFSTSGGCSNISSLGTGCSPTGGYTNYTTTQIHTTFTGSAVSYSITPAGGFFNKVARIWVDYNQNNTFDFNEIVATTPTISPNTTYSGTFTVPATALSGTTIMRVKLQANIAASNPCFSVSSGETEDYGFTIVSATPCSGAPIGGSAASNVSSVCYGNTANLSLSGATCATGIDYQWQYLNAGIWINVPTGGTNITYTTDPLTATSQYRARLTCTSTNQIATSAPVTITVNTVTPPYLEDFESITAMNELPGCMTVSPNSLGTKVRTWLTNQPNNRINHTPGGSKYATISPTGSSYLYTPALNLTGGQMYQYSFWYISDGAAGFSTSAAYYGPSPTPAGMINLIGTLAPPAVTNTTYQQFIGYFQPAVSGVYFIGLFNYATTPAQYLTIDDIEVFALPACTGTPTAGTVFPAVPVGVCSGGSTQLTVTGATPASNLIYQWQSSSDNISFTDVLGGSGFNSLTFFTPPVYDTTYFRLKLTCSNTNQFAFSNSIEVDAAEASYAPIPFTESFENWNNRCSVTDVPGINWATNPATGNTAWRREDQGASANWSTPTAGANVPTSAEGAHSARFHSSYASPAGSRGHMDLLLDCTGPGMKELQYYGVNPAGPDSMLIYLSTDGGQNFSQIGGFGALPVWSYQSQSFTSTSSKTVIRFQGKSEAIFGSGTDINIDAVQVVPPCAGTPNAGIISNATPCAGATFTLNLIGGAPAAGITYEWQSSPNGTTNWTMVPGGTLPILSTTISAPTYFRLIATCTNSSQADTTPVKLIQLANFYYCYCTSNATNSTGADIGNVTVSTIPGNFVLMNNGIATPLVSNPNSNNNYTNFSYLPPIVTYKDSMLRIAVTQITSLSFTPAAVAVFIDLNHNGIFDAAEKIYEKQTTTTSTPPQQVNDTFFVPDTAAYGITGMRIVLVQSGSMVLPCNTYLFGETEDYLIDIRYPPCTGPASAGTAMISDTSGCVGYTVIVSDTSHERQVSNIEWLWQYSPDGNSWADYPNSVGQDSIIYLVTGNTFFRLRMICYKGVSTDTTYSNDVHISINSPYACYCFSLADGGNLDTSDNSKFEIDNHLILTGGPHLMNPTAVESRTDYTDVSDFELFADSTYKVEIYHTLNTPNHADAKVTLFMDLNNDLQYDASERMWTAYSSPNNWYLTTDITIPTAVITNLRTGMRLILNNNTGPNSPSDDGCGAYTSGETEDYVIIFRSATSVVPNTASRLSGVDVYPNPSKGKFSLNVHGNQSLGDVIISVSNITGQRVAVYDYRNIGINFTTDLDLTTQSKGVYFVEVKANGEKMVRKVIVQ